MHGLVQVGELGEGLLLAGGHSGGQVGLNSLVHHSAVDVGSAGALATS